MHIGKSKRPGHSFCRVALVLEHFLARFQPHAQEVFVPVFPVSNLSMSLKYWVESPSLPAQPLCLRIVYAEKEKSTCDFS